MKKNNLSTILCSLVIVLSLGLIGYQLWKYFSKREMKEEKVIHSKLTTFKIRNVTYNCGKVVVGDSAKAQFMVLNTGKEDLFLEDIQPECHCTVPSWSRSAVKPGDSTIVYANVVEYSAIGPFTKLVTIISNTLSSPYTITIRGNFISKK